VVERWGLRTQTRKEKENAVVKFGRKKLLGRAAKKKPGAEDFDRQNKSERWKRRIHVTFEITFSKGRRGRKREIRKTQTVGKRREPLDVTMEEEKNEGAGGVRRQSHKASRN